MTRHADPRDRPPEERVEVPPVLDRLARHPDWLPERLAPWRFAAVICADGPIAQDLSTTAAGAGVLNQVVVAPAGGHAAAIDVARSAALKYGPVARVEAQTAAFAGPPAAEKIVYLVDAGDVRYRHLRPAPGSVVVGFAGTDRGIEFGRGLWPPPDDLGTGPRPSVPERAEMRLLVAELVNASCGVAGCLRGARGPLLSRPPRDRSTIPLKALPDLETLRRFATLYVAGFGGAVSHQTLVSLAIDRWARALLRAVWGSDPDRAEVHNVARQCGYDCSALRGGDRLKAPLTAEWARRSIVDPETEVRAFAEPLGAAHFEAMGDPGFTAVLSSVDSWKARAELAGLADTFGVQALLSAGAAFTTAEARLVTPATACMWRHGWERLVHREDPTGVDGSGRAATSCTQVEAQASSVVPQAFIGAWTAMALRDHLLGLPVDPRGIRVHLNRRSRRGSPTPGLCFSPGVSDNESCSCDGYLPARREGRVA